ncbi:MAG: DUF2207 domain-containing protein [Chloroflexi bacterium]|nr:DUF2207 domain-containing protein [Chloroflexota bacterium]
MRFVGVVLRIVFNPLILVPLILIGIWVVNNPQSERGVIVPRRDVDITIQTNGDVRMNETWSVQFSGGAFTFAFRGIALNRVESIDQFLVSENNVAYQQMSTPTTTANTFNIYQDKGQQFVKWFFPSTRDQTRVFNVEYTLHGALYIYDGGDQFWWKVIEKDRGYAIQNTTITLHLPASFETHRLRAAITTGRGTTTIRDGQTVVFTSQDLKPGNELEVRAQFPHGIVPAEPPAWQARAEDEIAALDARERARATTDLVFLLAGFILVFAGPAALYLVWFIGGRDPRAVAVAQMSQPPSELAPALVGTLVDEYADLKDIIATIVDLARRGGLQMSERVGVPGDYIFRRQNNKHIKLQQFESKLLRALFGKANDCTLSNVRVHFDAAMLTVQDEMYQAAVEQGFFIGNPQETRRAYLRWGWSALGASILIGLGSWFVFSDKTDFVFVPAIAFGLLALGLMVVSRWMPRRTPKGASERAKWIAFKRHLASIEKFTQLDQARELFDQYLPYTIALGLGKTWTQKFSTIETPTPRWFEMEPRPTHRVDDTRPFEGSARGGGKSGGGVPSFDQLASLDSLAGDAFKGLDAMSDRLFTMLDSTADTLESAAHSLGKSLTSSSGGSSSSGSSWHSSSSSSSGGWSGGGSRGGGGGGGGSSGFG